MKINWNLVILLLIALALVVGVYLILRGRSEPIVIPGEPQTVVEWKERVVPVVRWKEKQVPVPYYVYLPGTVDTLWLENVGYAKFDTVQVLSTVFEEKEISGLLKVTVGVQDSINAFFDKDCNVYIDKYSKLSLLNYELVKSNKKSPLEIELRVGAEFGEGFVEPTVGLGLLKRWGVVYTEYSPGEIGLGVGVRF